jgi:uncharacterized tellurite resistance protein B-like protein
MKLSELDDTERLALMALLRLIISVDRQVTQPEGQLLERVADEMGRDVFLAAREDAAERLANASDLKAALAAVTRQEARSLLYNLAWEVAESDELIAGEIKHLAWVAEQWGIEVDPSSGRPAG